jgi:anti-sigma factor RsiW
MNCDTYHELIVADLDGTLSPSERDAVRSHLDACDVCRNARALEAEFTAYLRRRARVIETPPSVQARLRVALAQADTPGRRPASLTALAAASLIAAALAFALLRPATPDFVRPATDDYRLAAAGRLALDVTTDDPRELARYFDGTRRLAFPSTVHDLTPAGFRLKGGAVRERGGVAYTVSVYERDGTLVLAHQFHADRPTTDETAETAGRANDVASREYLRADELGVWVMRDRKGVRCLTTRLPAEDLEDALSGTAPEATS